ncbi:hypothetical protein GCM10018954_070250 [Kutzneria kofuensis]
MQHGLLVGGGEGAGEGGPQAGGGDIVEKAVALHGLGEGQALDVLHDDGDAVIVLEDVVDVDAVLMADGGRARASPVHPLLGSASEVGRS